MRKIELQFFDIDDKRPKVGSRVIAIAQFESEKPILVFGKVHFDKDPFIEPATPCYYINFGAGVAYEIIEWAYCKALARFIEDE